MNKTMEERFAKKKINKKRSRNGISDKTYFAYSKMESRGKGMFPNIMVTSMNEMHFKNVLIVRSDQKEIIASLDKLCNGRNTSEAEAGHTWQSLDKLLTMKNILLVKFLQPKVSTSIGTPSYYIIKRGDEDNVLRILKQMIVKVTSQERRINRSDFVRYPRFHPNLTPFVIEL
jgi:hypothetical protein